MSEKVTLEFFSRIIIYLRIGEATSIQMCHCSKKYTNYTAASLRFGTPRSNCSLQILCGQGQSERAAGQPGSSSNRGRSKFRETKFGGNK